jgi:EAL domain-containing protein (putative c-di-GMP-specific phosphodiesterase class I)
MGLGVGHFCSSYANMLQIYDLLISSTLYFSQIGFLVGNLKNVLLFYSGIGASIGMTLKIPNRFLGYAYCVGDLLIELNSSYDVIHADGAIKSTLGVDMLIGETVNFLDLLDIKGRGIIKRSVAKLNGTNRLGPIMVNVGHDPDEKEIFGAFMAKLPSNNDVIYLVLSRPSRLGVTDTIRKTSVTTQAKKEEFFSKLENLFGRDPEAENKVQVTVIDASGDENLNAGQQSNIEKILKNASYDGSSASRVGEDKFALIHDRTNENATISALTETVVQATGASISSATINPADMHLSNKDNMRALVFSLQQFTEDSDGFDVESIQQNCTTMIGETTDRVRAFRKVLDEGAFSLVYQPIVNLKKGTTHHFEALTRFDLPKMMKSQWEMIRFAEDIGMIDDFDRSVINRNIQKIREMLGQGGASGIAVNISGRSLSDPEFIADLIQTLKANVDLKSYLSLEITESARIQDLLALSEVVDEIRGEGFQVYLDDFGAGAAGFQYLKSLKVDAIKIDGAYIKDALESREDRAFLKSMVTLCQDLGIITVGEWVETRDHATLLQEIGVDYGQGYFFGKPTHGMIASRIKMSA